MSTLILLRGRIKYYIFYITRCPRSPIRQFYYVHFNEKPTRSLLPRTDSKSAIIFTNKSASLSPANDGPTMNTRPGAVLLWRKSYLQYNGLWKYIQATASSPSLPKINLTQARQTPLGNTANLVMTKHSYPMRRYIETDSVKTQVHLLKPG